MVESSCWSCAAYHSETNACALKECKYPRCIICNDNLRWGGFAHNQNTCWSCFKDLVLTILSTHTGEEREILVWMMAIVAKSYGEEF